MELSKLLKTQISLTEWFANIGHAKTEEIREEDKTKRDRMEEIARITDFPVEERTVFLASDVKNSTPEFNEFYNQQKDYLVALRLTPRIKGLPKLRTRGDTLEKTIMDWFSHLEIDHKNYNANIIRHPKKNLWSTIFVSNKHGIFGEIIQASHDQLTQGFYKDIKPIQFFFDFRNWYLTEDNASAKQELIETIAHLHIENSEVQQKLQKTLNATFSQDYMEGYFETVTTEDLGRHYIDYNRVLGELYRDFSYLTHDEASEALLKGQTGCPGEVAGTVRIVKPDQISKAKLSHNEILVCEMTTPEYVVLMKQAGGIITNRGGILTHAAIVSRELGIPCLVGTENATEILNEGQSITLNATDGIVT